MITLLCVIKVYVYIEIIMLFQMKFNHHSNRNVDTFMHLRTSVLAVLALVCAYTDSAMFQYLK